MNVQPDTQDRRRRMSAIVLNLARRDGPDLTLGEILALFGDRFFGAAILLLAAPNLIPLPPGTSSVFGAPLLFITAQLALGRQTAWLPARLLAYRISSATLSAVGERLAKPLARAEKILKARFEPLLSPLGERLIGIACFLLSVVLFLPIPFGNTVPAAAMCLFALGILERDGLATSLGWLATVASVIILALISTALLAASLTFFKVLLGMQ